MFGYPFQQSWMLSRQTLHFGGRGLFCLATSGHFFELLSRFYFFCIHVKLTAVSPLHDCIFAICTTVYIHYLSMCIDQFASWDRSPGSLEASTVKISWSPARMPTRDNAETHSACQCSWVSKVLVQDCNRKWSCGKKSWSVCLRPQDTSKVCS